MPHVVDDQGAANERAAALYIAQSGTTQHTNTCATSRAPAYEPGPCDCVASQRVTDTPRK